MSPVLFAHARLLPLVFALCFGCAPADSEVAPAPAPPAVEAEKVATADPDPQERPAGEDEGEAVIEAKSRADVHAALGKTVRVVGRPENSKASPLLLLDSGESVYCRLGGSHWPDAVSGQRIAVTGEVVLLPGPIFPTATRAGGLRNPSVS